jgi:ornithine carbamoyltransferase
VKGLKHLLKISNLRQEEINQLIRRAVQLKADWPLGIRPRPLQDLNVALVFEKPSTRTRVSFEVGVNQLGGGAIFLSGSASQLSRSEPLRDTARVLSRYVQAIVMRTFGQERVEEMAAFATVPVINALTDQHHPCQVLSDLMTVQEHFGHVAGLRYCWLGDGNNMANSWIEAASLMGLELSLACPGGYEPDAGITAAAGANIRLTQDAERAVAEADVVSTDVWASMGQEDEAGGRRQIFSRYRLDEALLSKAAAGAIVLHCLPAHRNEEISEGVLEGPQAQVWAQAENRLHLQKALLEFLLG